MKNLFFSAILRVKQLIEDEQGQDLVEYALIVALIAFGAMSGMGYVAKGVNHAFSGIATTLTTDV
jgi:pilus assembly protein Flp/PilA